MLQNDSVWKQNDTYSRLVSLYDLFIVPHKYMSNIMIIVKSVIYINKRDKILICTKTVLLKYLDKSNIFCNDLS